jgi:hypothetical protein
MSQENVKIVRRLHDMADKHGWNAVSASPPTREEARNAGGLRE